MGATRTLKLVIHRTRVCCKDIKVRLYGAEFSQVSSQVVIVHEKFNYILAPTKYVACSQPTRNDEE